MAGGRRDSAERAAGPNSMRRTSGRVLLIFQAMDAAGKDGTIKHVMSGVNPQGCQVYSFKAPSPRNWTTTSCGAPRAACPSAAASASSTAPTTRRCWWCASIPSCWPAEAAARTLVDQGDLAGSASRTSTPSSATSRATACSSASSSCTFPNRSKGSAFCSGWTTRKRTGSSLPRRAGAPVLGRLHGGLSRI